MYFSEDRLEQPRYNESDFLLPNPFPGLAVTPEDIEKLLITKDYQTALEKVFEVCDFFNNAEIATLLPEQKHFINLLAEVLEKFFLSEEINFSPSQALLIIRNTIIFSNIFAASSKFENTDEILKKIRTQKNNIVRMLALTSFRNKAIPNPEAIFAAQPVLASLWLSSMLGYGNSSNSEHIYKVVKGLSAHPAFFSKFSVGDFSVLTAFPELLALYFRATYISTEKDREIREKIAAEVKKVIHEKFPKEEISKNADVKNVGVFSSKFVLGHSTYKAMQPLFSSLKGKYKLTYFHIAEDEVGVDRNLFDEVVLIKEKQGIGFDFIQAEKEAIKRNVGTAIFSDIGMSYESVMLASRRFAPIQIGCYGHPVSSHGLEVDYFIGGKEVEILEDAEKNYSERLVAIPGFAQGAAGSDYKPQNYIRSGEKIIAVNWGNTKFYYPQLLLLKKLVLETNEKIKLIFLGINEKRLEFPSTVNEIQEFFKEKGKEFLRSDLIFVQSMPFFEYMSLLEKSHLAVDSYPFGSFTRMIDALKVKLPVVTLKGKKSYNRVAARILEKAGVSELVANSEEEFLAKAKKLLEDDVYNNQIRQKLSGFNLEAQFPKTDHNFAKAIDFITENHEQLKQENSKTPIEIK